MQYRKELSKFVFSVDQQTIFVTKLVKNLGVTRETNNIINSTLIINEYTIHHDNTYNYPHNLDQGIPTTTTHQSGTIPKAPTFNHPPSLAGGGHNKRHYINRKLLAN